MSCETRGLPMLTTMVSGYYDANGSDVYPPESYGEYCYGVQDICSQMACSYHGPPGGVRMVNGNSGPIGIPLQIPTGHLVQQVVDENGTVRHILFSPPMPMPVGAHYGTSHGSTTLATPSGYYAYPQPPYATGPTHFHPQPPGPMQTMTHQGMHSMMQVPSPQSGSPPPCNLVGPPQKDDRYQRQRRKIAGRSKDCNKLAILPSQASSAAVKKERRKLKEPYEDGMRINGSSGSNASEDEEATWMLSEFLSNMKPPTIAEVSCRSAVICWSPPEMLSSEVEKRLCLSSEQNDIVYEVMMCEKAKEGHLRSIYSGTECHCTITPLKPSSEYYICMQASMDDVRGSTVKGPIFKTLCSEAEVPHPPRLCSRTKNSLTLKWATSSDNCPKVKSYVLEYDEGFDTQSFTAVYSGPLRQFKVTKLSASTCYRFRLSVVSEKGQSAYSSITSFYTSGNVPSQPLPPVLKQAYLNKLHLEWEKRTCDNDFSLQIMDENMRHGFLTTYSGGDRSFICSSLRGNTEYKFRLCANNEEGTSPWSKVVAYFTLPDKLSGPGKPIPKGRIHASCFRLTWDPPRENKQSSITKYILEVDRGFAFEPVYTGPETEFFLENLLPGTTYKMRVACISSTGHSPYSEVNSITTAAVNPGKCAAPRLQSKPESSFLCLEWAHPEYDGGSSISEYEVDMTSPDNVTLQAYKGLETSCVVNDLLPGRPYLFQVRAYNRVGAGPWSDPLEVVSGAGPPDAPRNFAVKSLSSYSCVLCWEEPVNNGATITSYQLQMNSEDSSEEEENFNEIYEGQSGVHEVSDLSPATQYYFRIRAVNEAGAGNHSHVLLCETPSSAPGAISLIHVSPASTSLSLSWNEPPSNGSEITNYNVELDDYVYSTESNVPELCIEDLTPEMLYRVRVQAVNSIGEGEFSKSFDARTLRSPPDAPPLECVSGAHNSLRLRWGEGRNHEQIYFTLEMSSPTKSFVPIYHGTGLSHKVNRLQESTAYHFRICASSDSGQGPYSQSFTFSTGRAPPPSLKAPKVSNITESSCLVEWAGAKHFSGHTFSYQLQLSTEGNADSRLILCGTETKCCLTDLEPQTHYLLRVATVRHYQDENLIGAYSPSTALTTSQVEHSNGTTSIDVLQSCSTPSFGERRTLKDKQCAALLALAFVVAAFLFTVLLENTFSFCQLS